MSKDHPRVQKELLLARMAADRVALRAKGPPRNTADFRLAPELKPWALPAVLFGLSMLKMPPFLKAPLRAIAVIALKNRVQDVMHVAQSRASGEMPRPAARPISPTPVSTANRRPPR